MIFVDLLDDITHLFVPHGLFHPCVLRLFCHHKLIDLGVYRVLIHELRVLIVSQERHNKRLLIIFVEIIMFGQ